MSVQVENLEKNMAKLTVTVSADKFEKAMQESYMKQRNRIHIPGFRKGKVPRAMIEKVYGPEVFYDDAANFVINEEYPAAMEESGLEIVSRPDIEVTQIEKGKEFIFEAEVAVKPGVKLGEYKGVTVTKTEVAVTDEEVDADIENTRNMQARTVEVTVRFRMAIQLSSILRASVTAGHSKAARARTIRWKSVPIPLLIILKNS